MRNQSENPALGPRSKELQERRLALKEAFSQSRAKVSAILTELESRDPQMARAAQNLLGDPRRSS
jgi:hypothetical protein